ncbi:MAG TPA: LysR substrate-binding domain-containing protein [Solirubrobacteraceae bacterium]|jgi:DNA-binding transcriptional LysR family regulator|nr:LysR substrate-binding domain-containing protein [Solirubrobacteraceae bacterium]
MLDLNRLRVLREVGRHGSFSAAAAALAYTQPAISRQIATLEREVGATLVERNPRGVRLTDAGEALVAHVEAILAHLADAEAEVRAIGELRGGRLRMAAFPTVAATIAPVAIAAFRRSHPDVTLTLTMAEPVDALPMLVCGELDIALSLDWIDEPLAPGIERLPLLDDPMYIALPATHRLAHRQRIALGDFRDEEWMLGTTHSCPDSRIFAAACRAAGFEPKLTFENDDYAAIAGFVAAGVGIAMIPDLAATSIRGDIVLRSLGPDGPVRQIVAATRANAYHAPATKAMLAALREASANWVSSRSTPVADGTSSRLAVA